MKIIRQEQIGELCAVEVSLPGKQETLIFNAPLNRVILEGEFLDGYRPIAVTDRWLGAVQIMTDFEEK